MFLSWLFGLSCASKITQKLARNVSHILPVIGLEIRNNRSDFEGDLVPDLEICFYF